MTFRFPEFKPSAAFLLLENIDKIRAESIIIEKINKFQNYFKKCTVVVIGKIRDSFWRNIQFSIPPGRLLFLFARGYEHAVEVIWGVLKSFNDAEKKQQQQDYFHQVRVEVSIIDNSEKNLLPFIF